MDLAAKEEKKEKGGKRDDIYAFHFMLPEAILQCDLPEYPEANYQCLMGYAQFDDAFVKGMFQKRIQGFVNCIDKRITKKALKEQEDYIVYDIVKEKYDKEEEDFKWDWKDGKMVNFRTVKKTVKAEKITFDVKNCRNLFEGKVVLLKKMQKHFKNDNEYVNKMTADEALFYNKSGELIMRIRMRFESDEKDGVKHYGYNEEGEFTHYKHIADINSFYMILKYT